MSSVATNNLDSMIVLWGSETNLDFSEIPEFGPPCNDKNGLLIIFFLKYRYFIIFVWDFHSQNNPVLKVNLGFCISMIIRERIVSGLCLLRKVFACNSAEML